MNSTIVARQSSFEYTPTPGVIYIWSSDDEDTKSSSSYDSTPMSVAYGKRKTTQKKDERLKNKRPESQVIYISSDSEEDDDKAKPAGRSRCTSPKSKNTEESQPVTPRWLVQELARVQELHATTKLEILHHRSPDGKDAWFVKCMTCSTSTALKTVCVGPGERLLHLLSHLRSRCHLRALGLIPPAPERRKNRHVGRSDHAPQLQHQDLSVGVTREMQEDAVATFVNWLGLPAHLAEKLRAFGMDEERMNSVAQWSQHDLFMLIKSMHAEIDVSWMVCLEIMRGLKAWSLR